MGRRPQKLELTWFNKDQALIPTEEGKYGYTWVDPKDPRYCEVHTLVAEGVVRGEQSPKEEGVTYSERADLEPTEDNLLILGESGDVLEALTQVPELADKYVGQVKCVYIDPPFNTAQTFANYEDNLEHSIWLTMMRDRLIHLRKLLSDDGSIWVHLDDVENHRMRMLMDEVFGSSNYVAEMQWEKTYSPRNDSKGIPMVTDVILVYRKSKSFSVNSLSRNSEMDSRYKNPDHDPKGPWKPADTTAPGSATHQGMVYAIQHPITGDLVYPPSGRHWSLAQESLLRVMGEWADYELADIGDEQERADLAGLPVEEVRPDVKALVLAESRESAARKALQRISKMNWPYFVVRKSGGFQRKGWLSEREGSAPRNLLKWKDVGHNDTAAKEIRALFPGQSAFSTPKPERLLERIIHIATNPSDIVLDIFGGSGTTAAAAQKMGRRWVTIELVEDTFNRFTLPRLSKVINGEDMGGISLTTGERVDNTDEGLPEGMTPDEAQKLTSLLNKAIREQPELKKNSAIKAVKDLVKTKKTKDAINWRGGGGFTVARLSPSCFDYDPDLDLTTLTEAATGSTLVASVAANLGFYLTPEGRHFDGILGRQHLAVVEGVLDDAKVDDLMAHLPEGHTLLIAATIVPEGVRDHVRRFKNGSRVLHIPLDLFTYTTAQEGK